MPRPRPWPAVPRARAVRTPRQPPRRPARPGPAAPARQTARRPGSAPTDQRPPVTIGWSCRRRGHRPTSPNDTSTAALRARPRRARVRSAHWRAAADCCDTRVRRVAGLGVSRRPPARANDIRGPARSRSNSRRFRPGQAPSARLRSAPAGCFPRPPAPPRPGPSARPWKRARLSPRRVCTRPAARGRPIAAGVRREGAGTGPNPDGTDRSRARFRA
jgi:hypothetical protein